MKEYISLDELNEKRKTGVTTYDKPSISERASQIKGFIKQKVAERKVTAPERAEKRARIKTALENLGNKASGNLSARAKKVRVRTNQGGMFGNNLYNQSSSQNNMFTQQSNLGSSPFTIGGKNNPYNFSGRSSAPKKKAKAKGIFIQFR
jgi:hypothetical protein